MKRKGSNRSISVSEQAAEWYLALEEPPHTEDKHRRFLAWLKQSPQHIEEFLAIAGLERTIASRSSSIAELVAEARAAGSPDAVAFVGTAEHKEHQSRRSTRRRRSRRIVQATAAGLAIVAALAFFAVQMPGTETPAVSHRTERGEQRSIALGDGSIVTLNTLSEAVMRMDGSARHVTLLAGEAMFDVARDPKRPFVVETGALSVEVVGTKFAIYRNGELTQVAVVEGVVSVTAARESAGRIELRGGQGAVFAANGEIRRDEKFDVQRAVAWTERRLIFDNARLADVAREFNRYNRTRLQIDDPALSERRITTVFNAHDVSALISFLALQPDVEVEYGVDSIHVGPATEVR